MNVWRSGTRSWAGSAASARISSSDGSSVSPSALAESASALTQHLRRVAQRPVARAQQDEQVVQDVGRLVVDAVVGLLARGAGDLLGLLLHLLADVRRVVEQRDGVGALGPLRLAGAQRALQRRQHLVGRGLHVAAEEAGALARVAGGAGRLDEGEQRGALAGGAPGPCRPPGAPRRAPLPQLPPA